MALENRRRLIGDGGTACRDSPLVAHAEVLDNLNLALQLRATREQHRAALSPRASKISTGFTDARLDA